MDMGIASKNESDILDSGEAGGRVLSGGALRFGAYLATVALSVVSVALLTGHLSLAGFSAYTTVISLVTLLSAITDAGMSNVGIHEYAVRSGADRAQFMRDLLGLRVALSMLGLALVVAFALAAGYAPPIVLGAALAGLGACAIVWQHTFSIPIAASLRLGTLAVLEMTRQLIAVAWIAALVILGAGVGPLLAVLLVSYVALIPITAVLARGEISARPSLSLSRWRALLAPTLSFSLAAAVGTIYVYTAQILTSLVATHHQSGIFAFSFRVFVVVAGVPGLLVGGALPLLSRAARDDRTRLTYAVTRMFDVTLVAGVGATLGLIAGAQFVVSAIAHSRYAAAVGVLQIQALALLASFVLAGCAFALLSMGRHRTLLITNAAAFAVSCALTLTLAGSDGATGAAIATVCGESTLAIGYLIGMARGAQGIRPRPAIVLKVALAAAPALAAALLVPGLPSVARMLLVVAVYGLVILITGALPRELMDILPRRRAPTN